MRRRPQYLDLALGVVCHILGELVEAHIDRESSRIIDITSLGNRSSEFAGDGMALSIRTEVAARTKPPRMILFVGRCAFVDEDIREAHPR